METRSEIANQNSSEHDPLPAIFGVSSSAGLVVGFLTNCYGSASMVPRYQNGHTSSVELTRMVRQAENLQKNLKFCTNVVRCHANNDEKKCLFKAISSFRIITNVCRIVQKVYCFL